jgi:hypothetical protein
MNQRLEVIVHRDPPSWGGFGEMGCESFFRTRAISRWIFDSLLTGCTK